MERRELLKLIALATGSVVIGGELFLTGCKTGAKADAGFSTSNISLLDEVGETIIPTTDSPGAKATQIGEFMKTMVTDTYNEKQQDAFMTGITKLDEACKAMHKKNFMECTPQERHDFLVSLEKEAKDSNAKMMAEDKGKMEALQAENEKLPVAQRKEFIATPPHYYTLMKQLTLLGYFTSKIGATQALRHVPVPSKYDGAYPYKKGDKAWAE